MELISLIGIIVSLVIIIWGSLRGYSLITLSTIAALVTAISGSISFLSSGEFLTNTLSAYSAIYISGVANMVIALFPLFLGGQIFGKILEATGLPMSVATAVFKRLGPKSAVVAVYLATLIMSVGGVNVFVIIFTMYPLAAAFFKKANISRSLIPACVLGGALAMQTLPGMPSANNILPAQAFNVSPMAGSWIAIVAFIIVGGGNLWYLMIQGKKSMDSSEGFVEREGDEGKYDIDLDAQDMLNPWLLIFPMSFVVILLNVFKIPAWASLYSGVIFTSIFFSKKIGGIGVVMERIEEGAKGSMGVMSTAAICGFASLIGAMPGYQLILRFLEGVSLGSPYIMVLVAVSVIAGFAGSATGGLNFVLANFTDKLIAMGGTPRALTRIIALSSLTFDSLPHNSAIVLTLNYCGVSHKEGYKHLFVTSVVSTLIASIVGVIMAHIGIVG